MQQLLITGMYGVGNAGAALLAAAPCRLLAAALLAVPMQRLQMTCIMPLVCCCSASAGINAAAIRT
jgi:hypothetical protein